MSATMHPQGESQPGSAAVDPSWFDVVERSPVATLLVEGGPHAVAVGRITYSNAMARSRFRLLPTQDIAHQSIFDLIDVDDHETIHSLLSATENDSPPIEVDVNLAIEPDVLEGGRSLDGRFALHLQSFGRDAFIVQLVVSDGWRAVDSAIAEQHRFRSALLELSDLAHATEDDDEFYQRLLERAVEVVPGAQGGSVQLGIAGTTGFRFVSAVGYDLAGLQTQILDRSDFFRDAVDPKAHIVREFSNDGRSPDIAEWLETVGRLSEIVVNVSAPVVVGGKPVAFLSLDNFEDPSAITETSVEMTTVLSRLIGDLWLRRRLEAALRDEREAFRHQAMHDPLTGLANRRSLDRGVRELLATNRKTAAPSAVLFADLDDFKGVNDRLGHEVGDLLLIAVAQGLRQVVGDAGLAGRWGGDEFLVIPTGLETSDQATELAAKILRQFEKPVRLDGLQYRARLSVGVGWSDDSDVTTDDLVGAGDQALYQAKAEGKGAARLRRC